MKSTFSASSSSEGRRPSERRRTGTIFHPRGRVKINGDQYSILNGLIEGLHVEVNGYGFTMNGTGPAFDENIALIE
jgi:hypothetical protein